MKNQYPIRKAYIKAARVYSETQLRSIVDEVLRRASDGALMIFHCWTFKTNQQSQYHQAGADHLRIDKQSILQTKYDDLL